MDIKQQHEIRAGKFTSYSLLIVNTLAISILITLSVSGHIKMTVTHLIEHFLVCQSIVLCAYFLASKLGHLPQTKYICTIFYVLMYTNDVVDISISHEVWLVAFFILTLSTLYLNKLYIIYTTLLFSIVQVIYMFIIPSKYMQGGINIQEACIRLAAFIFSGLICVITTEWGSSFITKTIEETKRADTDPLTGIFNHGCLMNKLIQRLQLSNDVNRPIVFLMIDIDFFKSVNDSHGHQYGDFVLKEMAFIISQCTREADMLARYGGEEFAVILDADEEMGYKIAERIRKTVENTQFVSYGIKSNITISIGLSLLQKEDSANTFIERADKNLYAAKHQGRNRVCRDSVQTEVAYKEEIR
jgi:diguanylate cyclase (GGDEF)-like protein